MFGYIVCDKNGIDSEELTRYRSYYCGMCKALQSYGQAERLSLNYDMTFLSMLLGSMYEPEEKTSNYRCPMHPLRDQVLLFNDFVDYGADMTIALAYHKNLDDWLDDHKQSARKYADSIKDSYTAVRNRYPRQCRSIEDALDRLHEVEKDTASSADEAVAAGGLLLSEVFVYRDDFWSGALREFGIRLGRFIYLYDAVMDYKSDLRKNNYNPLVRMNKKPEDMDEALRMEIGRAVSIFESLPLVNDVHLMRNILYSGVWTQYDAAGFGPKVKTDDDFEEGLTDHETGEQ